MSGELAQAQGLDGGLTVERASYQKQLLLEPMAFEERNLPSFVRIAIIAALVLVAGFIFWATVTPIEEVTVAPGEVVPSGRTKVIQHLEGGVIESITVEEGELVVQGQVLASMSAAQAGSEFNQSEARRAELELRIARLNAVLDGRRPDFGALEARWPALAANEMQIWTNQREANASALAVIESQIRQRKTELDQLQAGLGIAREQLTLARRQVAIRKDALESGVVSRQVYLETRRAEVTALGEVNRITDQIEVAKDALREAQQRRESQHLTVRQDILTEKAAAEAELAQVQGLLARLKDRVDRLEIRAPVQGLVQSVNVNAIGEVVQPGGILMELVPVDKQLEAEVRIDAADIGHVQPGQPVKMKMSSYEFIRYGLIPGTLTYVSPSTFFDENDAPYYRGKVRLERAYVGDDPQKNPILPGMTLDADIVTGEKTLSEYLLRPVVASWREAFRER